MNKSLHILLSIVLLFAISANSAWGQAKFKAANREYEQLSYMSAIRLYEDVLSDSKLDASFRKEDLKKLYKGTSQPNTSAGVVEKI